LLSNRSTADAVDGFYLGCRTGRLVEFQEFANLRVRICLKGIDEESFERLGIRAWPALMGDLFPGERLGQFEKFLRESGTKSRLELESLEAYPFGL